MQLSTVSSISERPSADLIVIPFWQGSKKAESACPDNLFRSEIAPLLDGTDFQGKEGETALIYMDKQKERRLLLLGCGKQSEVTSESIRRAVASVAKLGQQKGWTSINFICPKQEGFHTAITEGLALSNYSFNELKHDSLKDNKPSYFQKLCLIGPDKKKIDECKRVLQIANAVNFARDLINGNADDVTPQKLAETARELSRAYPTLKPTILGKKEISKAGLGLLMAVNRASFRDPALIIIEYRGNPKSKERTALIGKGITYDTGGLILKPKGGMETMKDDMSGAAAVLGTLKAVAALKLPVNIVGVIPSTENSIGPASYKPGDVYKSFSGKTVEIADTDAEGRLVLADAISYVQDQYKPTQIIDLATLTGGIIIALGEHVTGLFSNNDKLAKALTEAGEVTFERVWRMPLYTEYKEALKSSIADLKNAADRKASSINGALFIQEFVNKIPWAHLDIAGTAYLSAPRHYHPTPATGVGVRLLVEFFSRT